MLSLKNNDDDDADADADADADEDIFGGADDYDSDHVTKKVKAAKRRYFADDNLDKVASINQKTKLYKKVYDSFMEESTSEKEQLTTSTDVDQTVETVEEICTSLLTEEKELALVKLGKANMVS